MYKVNGGNIMVNGKGYRLKYPIREVEEYKNLTIVLIGVPFEDTKTLNNIYCFDQEGDFLWQAQDIKEVFPNYGESMYACYESMGILGDTLYATTFFGTCYHFDPENGKLKDYHFVK